MTAQPRYISRLSGEQVIAGNKKTLEEKDRLIEAMQKEIERLKGKQEESD